MHFKVDKAYWRRVVTALMLVSAIAAGASASAQQAGEDRYGIDPLFERFAAPDTPGCAVGVAQGGRTIFQRAYGSADLEHGVPNTPHTRFEAGSVSKQFTAAAILLLVEQGKLKLTDDVRRFIPELPDYGDVITIDALLHHTSGLRNWSSLSTYSGLPRGRHAYSNAEILDMASRQRGLNHPPGEEHSYTNTGYSLLALVVERLTGQTFASFTRERIFAPLGMNATEWRDDFRRIVKDRAIAYGRADGVYVQAMPFEDAIGSGGLITTVGDLTIWNEALTNGRLGATVTRQLQMRGTLNDGRAIAYARGLKVSRYRGFTEIAHSGSTAGYLAWLARYPDHQISIALLCNAEDGPVIAIGHAIADRLFPATKRRPHSLAPFAGWADKAGLFVDTRSGLPMRLTVAGDRLRIEGKDLQPVSAERFRSEGGDLIFRSHDSFTYISLDGPAREYRRKETPQLSPAALARFTGRYFSEELGATYEVVVRKGALAMRRERWPDTVFNLVPVYADAFEFDQGLVRFQAQGRERPSSLSISDPGARDLRFIRLEE